MRIALILVVLAVVVSSPIADAQGRIKHLIPGTSQGCLSGMQSGYKYGAKTAKWTNSCEIVITVEMDRTFTGGESTSYLDVPAAANGVEGVGEYPLSLSNEKVVAWRELE